MNKKIISLIFAILLIMTALIPAYADEAETIEEESVEEVVLFADGAEAVPPDVDSYFSEDSVENDVYEIAQYGDDAQLENEYIMTINTAPEKKTFSVGRLVAAMIIGFLIAFVALKIVAAPLKSVKGQNNANQYAVPRSFKLSSSSDAFLYKNIKKTPKPQQQPQQKK